MVEFTPSVLLFAYSIAIVFLLNVPYRFLMNLQEAAAIKAKAQEIRERAKYVQRQGNAMLSSQLLRESLAESNKMTKMTMKPMLVSLLIAVSILPILGNIYADGVATLNDGKGELKLNGNAYSVETAGSDVKILAADGTAVAECTAPCRKSFNGGLWNVVIEDKKVVLQRIAALLPLSLPFFADDMGWLGWYFMVSIPLMVLIRKMLKINI